MPWDRKQTHQTLRTNLIEEAYEAVDAINREDMDALYDELGDVLLQVVLHAEIGSEHGEFTIGDVTTAIASKMISSTNMYLGLPMRILRIRFSRSGRRLRKKNVTRVRKQKCSKA